MTNNPKVGELYWSVEPSIEGRRSCNYRPIFPWEGMVTHVYGNTTLVNLSRPYDPDWYPGSKSDLDTNTTAQVTFSELYTQEEAWQVYREQIQNHCLELAKSLHNWLRLQKFLDSCPNVPESTLRLDDLRSDCERGI